MLCVISASILLDSFVSRKRPLAHGMQVGFSGPVHSRQCNMEQSGPTLKTHPCMTSSGKKTMICEMEGRDPRRPSTTPCVMIDSYRNSTSDDVDGDRQRSDLLRNVVVGSAEITGVRQVVTRAHPRCSMRREVHGEH